MSGRQSGIERIHPFCQISEVEDVFREHANLKRLNDFLEGKSKHHHIFIFDQKTDVINDVGEPVDGPGDTKIIVTAGEQERLKGRAVRGRVLRWASSLSGCFGWALARGLVARVLARPPHLSSR